MLHKCQRDSPENGLTFSQSYVIDKGGNIKIITARDFPGGPVVKD